MPRVPAGRPLLVLSLLAGCASDEALGPDQTVPVVFDQLALGYSHGCAIGAAGTTYCWGGDGPFGAVGSGVRTAVPMPPTAVSGAPALVSLASRDPHTCGLLADGVALCWGRNLEGELGPGASGQFSPSPVRVEGGPWSALSVGVLTTCAIDVSQRAWCWGSNQHGVSGNPAHASGGAVPVPVASSIPFRSIVVGWSHACALSDEGGMSGDAWCWGAARSLGRNGEPDITTPAMVESPVQFTRLFAGGEHTCGITERFEAFCWGRNLHGQLGNATVIDHPTPARVHGGIQFVMLAGSSLGTFTCGLARTSQVYCWGDNELGQLGDSTTTRHVVPAPVATTERFVAVATGETLACGLRADRRIFCWGGNGNGELGIGATGEIFTVPTLIPAPP